MCENGCFVLLGFFLVDRWIKNACYILAQTELTLEAADSYIVRIELLYRELLAMELECGVLSAREAGALLNLSKAYDHTNALVDRLTSIPLSECLGGPVMVTGWTRRPSFHIPFEHLQVSHRLSVFCSSDCPVTWNICTHR